jgi:glycerophosphoryl diester phosphodiesterase
MRMLEPRLRLVLVGTGLPPAEATWLDGACVEASAIDERLVAGARRRGLELSAWTVNREAEMARLAALGVDAILTDDPATLRRVLDRVAA